MVDHPAADYHLGSDEDELARLDLQGGTLAPATRAIFAVIAHPILLSAWATTDQA
jgi:hypothetical protein